MRNGAIAVAWLAVMSAGAQPITIKTTTLLDGRGHVLRNKQIRSEGTRIAGAAENRGRATNDLSRQTVMLGWIDTHSTPRRPLTWSGKWSRVCGCAELAAPDWPEASPAASWLARTSRHLRQRRRPGIQTDDLTGAYRMRKGDCRQYLTNTPVRFAERR